MVVCTESIEINAPPEVVREKLLDWQSLSKYHDGSFFKSVEPKTPNKWNLEKGDKVTNTLSIGTFEATILENSPELFKWGGGVSGVFVGNHSFKFEPSQTNPGGTLFVQYEEFLGAFSFLIGDNMAGRMAGTRAKTLAGWAQFNKDLKAWCESSKSTS